MKFDLKNRSPEEIRKIVADAWLNIYVDEKKLWNPLMHFPSNWEETPELYFTYLWTRPEYFSFYCKEILNISLLPSQAVILRELWNHKFPILIAARGFGKSFLTAVYAIMRATLLPRRKIVVVGSAFRQSKVIYEYIESIWENAPILRSMVKYSGKYGPSRHLQDMWKFHLNDSSITALPIGDGSKIRGQRAQDIYADEFAAQSEEVFENVISGFASVKVDPIKGVKQAAAYKMYELLEELTGEAKEDDDEEQIVGNQTILSGTAYYDFNHFCRYWKDWKEIIQSGGNQQKLLRYFQRKALETKEDTIKVPDDFNWKDFCIIRIPIELVPKGFMDEANIARAKATINSGQFMMEYAACHGPNTKIITTDGTKKIKDINVGDMVLTHKGRFKPVKKVTYRKYIGNVLKWKTYGYNQEIITTKEHPFWIDNDWYELNYLDETNLINLKELNNKKYFDSTRILTDYLETKDNKIYPRPSQSRFELKELRYIRQSKKKSGELAREFDVKPSVIDYIKSHKANPKNSFHPNIPLNYNFGLIVGYYAAKGSVGADGRSVGFALDGHVDKKLEYYVQQLTEACNNIFGFKPKKYKKEQNLVSINIHQRLVVDLMKWICPGVCDKKYIKSEILYSNVEFLKGFIIGYWNGDGHCSEDIKNSVVASSASEDLLSQIRVVLSYFNISSSILMLKKYKNNSNIKAKKQQYALRISGEDSDKFRSLFGYNTFNNINNRKNQISNTGNFTKLPIKYKKLLSYDDYVYNIEVIEDKSYCLLNSTVHNSFSKDSNGFFKRSLIESCVAKEENHICLPSEKDIVFHAHIRGRSELKYVYGIDPATMVDNFAIVVLELRDDHRRIVYCWTSNSKNHKALMKKFPEQVKETDFYAFCSRKIRELMKVFPCARIGIDTQGGGYAIAGSLTDEARMKGGELPIWPVIDRDNPQESDGKPGLHLIEFAQFAKYDWLCDANNGLRQDFENKTLLFPSFDPLELGFANLGDESFNNYYDTLEDCVNEIEELKDELAQIIITETPSGKDKWDTPEVKLPGNKKGRMRKDRYSALLIANAVAKNVDSFRSIQVTDYGTFAHQFNPNDAKKDTGAMYHGPDFLVKALEALH